MIAKSSLKVMISNAGGEITVLCDSLEPLTIQNDRQSTELEPLVLQEEVVCGIMKMKSRKHQR